VSIHVPEEAGPLSRHRARNLVLSAVAAAFVMSLAELPATSIESSASGGGGGGGGGGGSIWAATWWSGNPQGGGPYVPGEYDAAAVCIWTDIGGTVGDLTSALATADLPASFWPVDGSGYSPGEVALERWALRLSKGNNGPSHFDVVACPSPGMVPAPAGEMYTAIPAAASPSGPQYIWVFWDTVPDPGTGPLPPLIGEALSIADLPRPVIHMSPDSVGPIADATLVNFPTWFWIDSSAWRSIVASAAGGGLVATVWATPQAVLWRASWDYANPASNPEHGVDLQPTVLDLACPGPGQPYSARAGGGPGASSPDCGTTFSQATFGDWVPLTVSISWDVWWTLTSTTGVVGGEGELPTMETSSSRPLRVAQVESVVSAA
jgi:hypothetical protein